jgi:hypothetical protein
MSLIDRSATFSASGEHRVRAEPLNSHAWKILHRILDRIKMMPYFAGFKFRTTPALPIQPGDIPVCGVYLLREDLGPDGDPNHGEPRFIHTVQVGFSVWIQNNEPELIDRKLDVAFMTLLQRLMTDSTLHGFKHDELDIEGFPKGSRTHHYGTVGSNNEMPVAELRFDLSFTFRTYWPPIVDDDLKVIHVRIEPDGMTEEVQDVVVEYDLPQD